MENIRKRKRPGLTETQKWAVLVRYFLYYDVSSGWLPDGAMQTFVEELLVQKRNHPGHRKTAS